MESELKTRENNKKKLIKPQITLQKYKNRGCICICKQKNYNIHFWPFPSWEDPEYLNRPFSKTQNNNKKTLPEPQEIQKIYISVLVNPENLHILVEKDWKGLKIGSTELWPRKRVPNRPFAPGCQIRGPGQPQHVFLALRVGECGLLLRCICFFVT